MFIAKMNSIGGEPEKPPTLHYTISTKIQDTRQKILTTHVLLVYKN